MEIDSLISVLGCIAGLVSPFIFILAAKRTAKAEIEKLKMSWNREDQKEYDREFSEMFTAVRTFMEEKSPNTRTNAIEKINIIRFKSKEPTARLLNNLYAKYQQQV